MQQTTYMCPFCLSSDNPMEIVGDWETRRCSLCKKTFSLSSIKGKGYEIDVVNYFDTAKEEAEIAKDSKTKNGDIAIEHIVQESTDNLFHEIQMTRIFREKEKKEEEKAISTELDQLFNVIFAR